MGRYTETDIRSALVAVALCAGDTRRAHAMLKENGVHVPRETMREWATKTKLDTYAEVRAEVIPRVHAQIAADWEDIVRIGQDKTRQLLEKVDPETSKQPAAEALKVATVIGIGTDKVLPLRDKPTHITEVRQADDIIRKLKRAGVIKGETVEGHAVEEVPELPPAA